MAWQGPGTCVVLGSPGTGATTTLVEAVVARLAEVPPSQMLVLARDRDAVRSLRGAIARRASGVGLPTVTTFHGLAYSLVRRTVGPAPESAMPRLLSGAEEDARIRDVLRGAIADGDIPWPGDLLEAASTLGLANDLRAMLARARELGLDPQRLTDIGHDAGVPAWAALGRLAEIDAQVMALEGVIDYSGLLELSIGAASEWPGTLRHIFVDDFQESGALQRGLLRALTGPGTATLVMADPDVAAFAFRGGDRLGPIRLMEESSAEVMVLDRVHAMTQEIWTAYSSVRRQPALPGISAPVLLAYRQPQSTALPEGPGTVNVITHDTWGDLVAWVADDVRRLHLGSDDAQSVPWHGIAIIARSTSELEGLRRACVASGVPVALAVADMPLPDEPAVATLLAAVSAALDPDRLTARAAIDLITGPLLALDPGDLRLLARALRDRFRAFHPDVPTPPGLDLVRDQLAVATTGHPDEDPLPDPASRARDRVVALGLLLSRVRACAESGASPSEVLWEAWSGAIPDADSVAWPERLRRGALAGQASHSHDLDAVLALFATAERLSDRYSGVVGITGLLAALQGQRLAAERVAAVAPATSAVSLTTPHGAVGRRWDHVVVVGAQEGTWPPPIAGSSALRLPEWEALVAGADAPDAPAALRTAATERMAQERRLFALAVSRARASLTVAAVRSDAEHPSRFVDDLAVEPRHRSGRPPRPLTLDGIVARLRTCAQDLEQSPALREAAVQRLATLAVAVDDEGGAIVPRADPATWWGVDDITVGLRPVRPADRPVPLSGSGLASLQGCPLRWFLSRVVRAEGPRGRALAVGSLVHVLAERAARGEIPAEPAAMLEHVDRVWAELPFDAPWESIAERQEVAQALERLCAYLGAADPSIAVEHEFTVTIPVAHGPDEDDSATILVRGAIDRIEVTADGRVRLIDFKTARNLPSADDVESDPQLGMYQLAVRHGALDALGVDAELAGAALVQLRAETKAAPGRPRVQEQSALGDADWLEADIRDAVARIRAEDFPAVVSHDCRTCTYTAVCPAQLEGREVLA